MDQVKSLEALVRLELKYDKNTKIKDSGDSLESVILWTRQEMRKAAQRAATKPRNMKKAAHA
jgi:hypothetical protein